MIHGKNTELKPPTPFFPPQLLHYLPEGHHCSPASHSHWRVSLPSRLHATASHLPPHSFHDKLTTWTSGCHTLNLAPSYSGNSEDTSASTRLPLFPLDAFDDIEFETIDFPALLAQGRRCSFAFVVLRARHRLAASRPRVCGNLRVAWSGRSAGSPATGCCC